VIGDGDRFQICPHDNMKERLESVEFIGIQHIGRFEFAMFNDPETGTTFCLREGETLGQAMERVIERYDGKKRPMNAET
jgi:hypothetical protein